MVSDDTDHSVFVAQALVHGGENPDKFAEAFALRLRLWLLCLPAGIGMATLKSAIRLWCGVPCHQSGVLSAGNGAAMRSAVIGVVYSGSPEKRALFVRASSTVTHSDPRAISGALAVADIAARLHSGGIRPTPEELELILRSSGSGPEWEECVRRTVRACVCGCPSKSMQPDRQEKGVSGFILETLPAAVSVWYANFGNFRRTVEAAVSLGGDTDTVAAIAGSLSGITCGKPGIPEDWIAGIIDFPHSANYISKLSRSIAGHSRPPTSFSWFLFPRGIIFTTAVLCHGLRRLIPPY